MLLLLRLADGASVSDPIGSGSETDGLFLEMIGSCGGESTSLVNLSPSAFLSLCAMCVCVCTSEAAVFVNVFPFPPPQGWPVCVCV